MDKKERIKKLSKLTPSSNEVIRIVFKNKPLELPVVEIPLEYLVYNKYNGRIKAVTLSYEKEYGTIDPIEQKDLLISFLWNSAEARNKQTKESIRQFGQQKPGIVTKDGIIIDGNRRASLISKINSEIEDEKYNFRAVILPDELEESRKDIIYLETVYQIGVDSKVDYDPIEKYLRCKELENFEYSHAEIANMMATKESQIHEWLEMLELMNDYLKTYGYSGIYTRLDKREGYFVDLYKYLRTYNGIYGEDLVDWNYDSENVEQLKNIYFDYIRMRVPVHKAREIGRTSNAKSFFVYKDIWRHFVENHLKNKASFSEPEIEELKDENPDSSYSELAWKKDQKWIKEMKSAAEETLNYFSQKLYEKKKSDKPIEILQSVLSTLEDVSPETLNLVNPEELKSLLNKITLRINKLMN